MRARFIFANATAIRQIVLQDRSPLTGASDERCHRQAGLRRILDDKNV
jgi:hypothetical protein